MPITWQIRCYVSNRGENVVKTWFDRQDGRTRGKFLSRIRILAQREAHEWTMPYFRWLHGECEGLGEIRFETGNVQHRPLGFRGPSPRLRIVARRDGEALQPERVFTLVICAEERGGDFVPGTACATGLQRKREVEISRERSNVFWLALE